MIKSVGQGLSTAIEAAKVRETAQPRTAPVETAAAATKAATTGTAVASVIGSLGRMAADGPPIDLDKVQRIKAAIASGNYPVDADAIADKMVELDLPRTLN